jgi:hypothetical protein
MCAAEEGNTSYINEKGKSGKVKKSCDGLGFKFPIVYINM